MSNLYNSDYYNNGKKLGISGYENYRWLPELTIPMAKRIIEFLNLTPESIVLDYGCAKGYLVRALRELKINAYGYDISEYCIKNSDLDIKNYLSMDLDLSKKYDLVISKDVLEHLTLEDVEQLLDNLHKITNTLFFIIPLGDGLNYNIPEYNQDITHILKLSKHEWEYIFKKHDWNISFSEYHINGLKDNYKNYLTGNGFFILRK
jgi:cyclopropane fatty-acyl-phospholipid synthase-like methyltransferase